MERTVAEKTQRSLAGRKRMGGSAPCCGRGAYNNGGKSGRETGWGSSEDKREATKRTGVEWSRAAERSAPASVRSVLRCDTGCSWRIGMPVSSRPRFCTRSSAGLLGKGVFREGGGTKEGTVLDQGGTER
jgi:hypothetical protein